MRHKWVQHSLNVAICRLCGAKRVCQKQDSVWRKSVPDYMYTVPLSRENISYQRFAGECLRHWFENFNLEYRSLYYREPAQKEMFR
jgi:hypothetical protein